MKKASDNSNQTIYLDGLKKYQERGIPILIDGVEVLPTDWDVIFQVCEDGSFYMGDYILEDKEEQEGEKQRQLKEIRFDKVYYR